MKRWTKEEQKEWKNGDRLQQDWLNFCDRRVNVTISDCIKILEGLRKDYVRLYEREALTNAIRYLKSYEKGEDVLYYNANEEI